MCREGDCGRGEGRERGGRGVIYVFDIGLRDQPLFSHIHIHRQYSSHGLHNSHALLLAETTPLQIFHERIRVEMVHIRRRVQMRRFMLFWFFDCRGAHLKHRFEWLGGAGFVFADGVGGGLFGMGFRGVEFGGSGGGVAHCGCNCSVTGDVWLVFVTVFGFWGCLLLRFF